VEKNSQVTFRQVQASSEGVVESWKEANNKVEAVALQQTVEEARVILARFERGRGLRGMRAWRTVWRGMYCGSARGY
jgi:hypothetical protein